MNKELDGVYNFSDAVTAVQEHLNRLRDQQEEECGPDEQGMYLNWDMYHVFQGRIEVVEEILEDLTKERTVAVLLREADDRESAS
jgi:hypothetical protein